jgi:hypothetical protein
MTLPNAKMPNQEPRPLSLVEEKRQQAQHDLDHWVQGGGAATPLGG